MEIQTKYIAGIPFGMVCIKKQGDDTYMLLQEMEQNVKHNLERAVQGGTSLYLEGKRSTPEDIVKCCVNEDMSYMPDYVWNERGTLIEIRYDKIKST